MHSKQRFHMEAQTLSAPGLAVFLSFIMNSRYKLGILFLLGAILLLNVSCSTQKPWTGKTVHADVETKAVASAEDAADDPAIWVHPENPKKSVIIGTDKNKESGALYLYDLEGNILDSYSANGLNNVDVRQNVILPGDTSGQTVDIIAASKRSDSTIAMWTLDSSKTKLVLIPAQVKLASEPYGFCLGYNSRDSLLHAFIPEKSGMVRHLILTGTLGALVWDERPHLETASQNEGCVVDDEQEVLWVGEEARGLWKFSLKDGEQFGQKSLVDSTGTPRLTADVEGVTIAKVQDTQDSGWIIVSSQGNNTYAVYNRSAPHEYQFSFAIGDSANIDGTSETDGIDVYLGNLGPDFPMGIFVSQDDVNDCSAEEKNSMKESGEKCPLPQNFKFVRLEKIIGD